MTQGAPSPSELGQAPVEPEQGRPAVAERADGQDLGAGQARGQGLRSTAHDLDQELELTARELLVDAERARDGRGQVVLAAHHEEAAGAQVRKGRFERDAEHDAVVARVADVGHATGEGTGVGRGRGHGAQILTELQVPPIGSPAITSGACSAAPFCCSP